MDWIKYAKPERWHDAAKLFPLLDTNSEEFKALVLDIRDNGLQNPVVLSDSKVLDGRNRLRACVEAGVKPAFVEFHQNGVSPLAFVIAQNLRRRHLTTSQQAAAAALARPAFSKQARERQIAAGENGVKGGRGHKSKKASAQKRAKGLGKATEQVAAVFGVSARYVEKAVALEKKRPGTLKKLLSGKTTLQKADKEIHCRKTLAEQFKVPPFSVLDAKQGYWQERKRAWVELGIRGEKGRGEQHVSSQPEMEGFVGLAETSMFDPVLCECVYTWFAPRGGRVLDPFAGESTKGIVAAKIGLEYTGIELRSQQVAENRRQAKKVGVSPTWIRGDAEKLTDHIPTKQRYDLIFTSPPYYKLEIYSANKKDGSTFESYEEFMVWYEGIFRQAVSRLKPNRFLVVKVGEFREKGFYRNFVGDNISCFLRLGLRYYNEAVLATAVGTAPMRVRQQFPNYRKLVKTHQNLLCFFNGDDPKQIPAELGLLGDAGAE